MKNPGPSFIRRTISSGSWAKFFPKPDKCQSFFAGDALMENFDVKTRGPNKGTSAMQRAGIDLDDFRCYGFLLGRRFAEATNISGLCHRIGNHPSNRQNSC